MIGAQQIVEAAGIMGACAAALAAAAAIVANIIRKRETGG